MASLVLSFGGKEIKIYELTKPATVIGRDPAVDIVIDNLGVSRSHCQFLRRGAAFILQDMNSSNGTYVNGQKVGEHNLNNGDQIVVGKYTLTFKNENQAAPAASEHEKIVPDSLNTYMMDGDKIRQRLEEMRRADQAAKSAPAAEPAPAAPVPAAKPTQTAPVADQGERHTKIVMGGDAEKGPSVATLKRYLYASLVVIVVMSAFICYLLVQLQNISQTLGQK